MSGTLVITEVERTATFQRVDHERPGTRFILPNTTEALQRRFGALNFIEDDDRTSEQNEELELIDVELQLRGYPASWEANPPFMYADDDTTEAVTRCNYKLNLQRRTWLCSSEQAYRVPIVGPWALVIGPTGLNGELCVPEKVAIYNAETDSQIDDSRRAALAAIEELAQRLTRLGLDAKPLLGVSLKEIQAAQTCEAHQ